MNHLKTHLKQIGILGGGQLARMLIEAASHIQIQPILFAESLHSSAAQIASKTVVGSVSDEKALKGFFSQVDLVLFENEFVPIPILRKLAAEFSVEFFPSLDCMEILQNKISQKNILLECSIPTAEFIISNPEESADEFLKRAKNSLGEYVLKLAMQGYDGKGVCVVDSSLASMDLPQQFCEQAFQKNISVYAEKKILFKRELAMMSCRAKNAELVFYPLVISEQWEGICNRVYGPATSLGVSPSLETHAQHYARQIAEKTDLMGVFALELFETENGELLVNEIAPRVHNSGHYTQDSSKTSQFENHLRAAVNMSLGSTQTSDGFAMQNLLGPEDSHLSSYAIDSQSIPSPFHLHWYGKEIKSRRKVGHINGVEISSNNVERLLKKLEESSTNFFRKK